MSKDIFCTISAQPDNLGDILIRQAMIDLISDDTIRLHVNLGPMPGSYVEAFSFPPTAILYHHRAKFLSAFLKSALRANANFVLPPGPVFMRNRRNMASGLSILSIAAFTRLMGGRVATIGRAVRGSYGPAVTVERLVLAVCNTYIVRDSVSASELGRKLEEAPDLGFREIPSEPSSERKFAALSIRSDSYVPDEFVSDIVRWARRTGLEPIFVTQVQRDSTRHSELALNHGVAHIDWDGNDHSTQMQRLRRVYSQSSIVVTDRLHVAILAYVEGANPIAIDTSQGGKKVTDTFELVTSIPLVGFRSREALIELLDGAATESGSRAGRAEPVRLAEAAKQFRRTLRMDQ